MSCSSSSPSGFSSSLRLFKFPPSPGPAPEPPEPPLGPLEPPPDPPPEPPDGPADPATPTVAADRTAVAANRVLREPTSTLEPTGT